MPNQRYKQDLKKKLKEAFDEVDTDKSGSIDKKELKLMLHKAGYEASNKMITSIMQAVDVDRNGTLDFEEFSIFFLDLGYKIQLAMKLRKQFEELDTDKSGYITRNELRAAVKETNSQGLLNEKEIDDFIKTADANGDGKISLDEWIEAMMNVDSSDEEDAV